MRLGARTGGIASAILLALCVIPSHAGIDSSIEAAVSPLAETLSNFVFYKISFFGAQAPLIVLWLVCAALFFTLYLGFINLRALPLAFRLVRGDYHDPKSPGEISHFQAVATAISGTVGIGNIGGVAVAITLGGPGAAFWLAVAGFLAMSTKLVECTLGVKYRIQHRDGSVSGGPMYYLEYFLSAKNYPRLGRYLGCFYAMALVIGCLGIGNMFQSNQAYIQFVTISGGENSFFADKGWLFGIGIALAVGIVIIGGIRSIAAVAGKIVPFMALLYVISCLVIIGMSAEHIPYAFQLIISQAFDTQSISGGMVGAMMIGFQRAVFSNEAGIGSAPIAHSAVQTHEPASEGIVSLLEPLIDTLFICTLTSLVIITTAIPTQMMDNNLEGIALTSAAFEHHISWAPVPLGLAALLFAFSTSIAWSYYGLKGWTYLFGEHSTSQIIFKIIFCGFIALGCTVQLNAVLNFSDAMVFLLAIPNIIGLYFFAPTVKREITQYMHKINTGAIVNYRLQRQQQSQSLMPHLPVTDDQR